MVQMNGGRQDQVIVQMNMGQTRPGNGADEHGRQDQVIVQTNMADKTR